ncbi:MAG: hypothetical protein OXU23_26315 [Candidatus Poribacteria bacterium]|nr:hypothetical protein [Candidatus Poribacteria bacterium]
MRDLMLRSGRKLLEVCVSQAASRQSAASVECPECEQACRPIQKRGVNITTLCGKIRVQHWVYECVSGHYHRHQFKHIITRLSLVGGLCKPDY